MFASTYSMQSSNLDRLCSFCNLKVYSVEQIIYNGHYYHKKCFRCYQCQRKLNLSGAIYANGFLYCYLHGSQHQNQFLSRSPVLSRYRIDIVNSQLSDNYSDTNQELDENKMDNVQNHFLTLSSEQSLQSENNSKSTFSSIHSNNSTNSKNTLSSTALVSDAETKIKEFDEENQLKLSTNKLKHENDKHVTESLDINEEQSIETLNKNFKLKNIDECEEINLSLSGASKSFDEKSSSIQNNNTLNDQIIDDNFLSPSYSKSINSYSHIENKVNNINKNNIDIIEQNNENALVSSTFQQEKNFLPYERVNNKHLRSKSSSFISSMFTTEEFGENFETLKNDKKVKNEKEIMRPPPVPYLSLESNTNNLHKNNYSENELSVNKTYNGKEVTSTTRSGLPRPPKRKAVVIKNVSKENTNFNEINKESPKNITHMTSLNTNKEIKQNEIKQNIDHNNEKILTNKKQIQKNSLQTKNLDNYDPKSKSSSIEDCINNLDLEPDDLAIKSFSPKIGGDSLSIRIINNLNHDSNYINSFDALDRFLDFESKYVSFGLRVGFELFVAPLKRNVELKRPIISLMEINRMFLDYEAIYNFNANFMQALIEMRMIGKMVLLKGIGKLFLNHIPFLKMYSNFIATYKDRIRFAQQLKKNSSSFRDFCEVAEGVAGNSIDYYLKLPAERILHYLIHVTSIYSEIPENQRGLEHATDLADACGGLNKIGYEILAKNKDSHDRNLVLEIDRMFFNGTQKIVKPCRKVIKYATLERLVINEPKLNNLARKFKHVNNLTKTANTNRTQAAKSKSGLTNESQSSNNDAKKIEIMQYQKRLQMQRSSYKPKRVHIESCEFILFNDILILGTKTSARRKFNVLLRSKLDSLVVEYLPPGGQYPFNYQMKISDSFSQQCILKFPGKEIFNKYMSLLNLSIENAINASKKFNESKAKFQSPSHRLSLTDSTTITSPSNDIMNPPQLQRPHTLKSLQSRPSYSGVSRQSYDDSVLETGSRYLSHKQTSKSNINSLKNKTSKWFHSFNSKNKNRKKQFPINHKQNKKNNAFDTLDMISSAELFNKKFGHSLFDKNISNNNSQQQLLNSKLQDNSKFFNYSETCLSKFSSRNKGNGGALLDTYRPTAQSVVNGQHIPHENKGKSQIKAPNSETKNNKQNIIFQHPTLPKPFSYRSNIESYKNRKNDKSNNNFNSSNMFDPSLKSQNTPLFEEVNNVILSLSRVLDTSDYENDIDETQ